MSALRKIALHAEVAICFFPAAIALLITAVGLMSMFALESEVHWRPRLEAVSVLFAGSAGMLGALYMLTFIADGRRTATPRKMMIYCISGLGLAGYASVDAFSHDATLLSILLPAAPFVCGVHLLYLGRSYFKA